MLVNTKQTWVPSQPGASLQNDIFFSLREESEAAAQRFSQQCQPELDTVSPSEQIHNLNNYWRLIIGMMPGNTVSERETLVDNIDPKEWMANFKTYIQPLVVDAWK